MLQLETLDMSAYTAPDFMKSVIDNRYFSYSSFMDVLNMVLDNEPSSSTQMIELGKSVLEIPIYGLTLGSGKHKILMWSQMHGNESTTTRSLLMFVDWFLKSELQSKFKLYIIPVLNPDGLSHWTRENANNIDLNRDAQNLSQPESQLLRSVFDTFKPDYCFNLHDQRTIYGIPSGSHAVQCSFLSPAANQNRDVTPARIKAMSIINHMVGSINENAISQIGRYGDGFNANCVGDTFQALGTPTILFEAGQSDEDYYRNKTMELITLSLQSAIKFIEENNKINDEEVITSYNSISAIETNYCDVLIKNVPSGRKNVDLSIMYKEVLKDNLLHFVPILSGVNDIKVVNAHRVIDLKSDKDQIDFEISVNQKFISNNLDICIFY